MLFIDIYEREPKRWWDCFVSNLYSQHSSVFLFKTPFPQHCLCLPFSVFICPANLSAFMACHPGSRFLAGMIDDEAAAILGWRESTGTLCVQSLVFPGHGWSRSLPDLVKGFICYLAKKQSAKTIKKPYHCQFYILRVNHSFGLDGSIFQSGSQANL